MKLKYRVIFFILIILFISIICSSCSKNDEEPVDNSKEVSDDMSLQDNSKSMIGDDKEEDDNEKVDYDIKAKDSEDSKTEDSPEKIEDNDTSPWKLLSESSVETKVEYGGFLNESIGITVGYAGATSYTEDGGVTWAESDNVSACRYGLDYYDESFIVTSGNSGVNLVSIDKGKTWTNLTDFPLKRNGEYNKFLSVIDTDNIYIGSKISLGVSNDGGITWKELKVPDGCKNIVGMFFMTTEIGYLMSSDGTLYITNDACESWTTQVIDLQGEKIAISKMPSAAINFQDENNGIIVYSTMSYKVFGIKTEDGGSTWETIDMPEVHYLAPYISRDGQYLSLSSSIKKICLYKLDKEG
ncbi:MAG: hypothetical protein PHC56_02055 [Herbinix sp.]|nr:hypothetical protein [Herbinix sp.]